MSEPPADVDNAVDDMKQEFLELVESGNLPVSGDLTDRHVSLSQDTVDLVLEGLDALKDAGSLEEQARILIELEALTAGAIGSGIISQLDSYKELVENSGMDKYLFDLDEDATARLENEALSMDSGEDCWLDVECDLPDFDVGAPTAIMHGDSSYAEAPEQKQDVNIAPAVSTDFSM